MLCTKDEVTGGSQSDVVKMMCTGLRTEAKVIYVFVSNLVVSGSDSESSYTDGILASLLSSTVLTVEAFLTGNVMSEVNMSP